MLHIALAVYGYSGGMGCVLYCKFYRYCSPWSHLALQVLTQLPAKLLYIALTVYGYSGGVGCVLYCKFLRQQRPVVASGTVSFSRNCRPMLHLALIALTATAGGCTSPF